MAKRITQAQQEAAYDHGYRSFAVDRPYENPYDSDKFWLLYMAYEQGWHDRAAAIAEEIGHSRA
jgi:hypothetical protein